MYAVGFDIEFILYDQKTYKVANNDQINQLCSTLRNEGITCHLDVNNIEFNIPPIELTTKKAIVNHIEQYFDKVTETLDTIENDSKYCIIPFSNAYHYVGGHIHISSDKEFFTYVEDMDDMEDALSEMKRLCSRSSRVAYDTEMIRKQYNGQFGHKYYYEFRPLESYIVYQHSDIVYDIIKAIIYKDYNEIDNLSHELRDINTNKVNIFYFDKMNSYLPFIPEKSYRLKLERNIIEQYRYYDIDYIRKEYINSIPDKETDPYANMIMDYYYYNENHNNNKDQNK